MGNMDNSNRRTLIYKGLATLPMLLAEAPKQAQRAI